MPISLMPQIPVSRSSRPSTQMPDARFLSPPFSSRDLNSPLRDTPDSSLDSSDHRVIERLTRPFSHQKRVEGLNRMLSSPLTSLSVHRALIVAEDGKFTVFFTELEDSESRSPPSPLHFRSSFFLSFFRASVFPVFMCRSALDAEESAAASLLSNPISGHSRAFFLQSR